jgi:ABC-2 type transport system ATP-binding protein
MPEPLVIARNVTKNFGAKVALDDVSAEVLPGDIIGVLGKNGAGKTTLLETVLGFSPPTKGSTAVFGEDALHLSGSAKARIGFLSQQDEMLWMLTGRQQLAIVAAFHAAWDRTLIDRLVTEWAVPLDQRIDSLSVGERQKLAVLLALGHEPDLLVLDEPVASLDPIARRQFLQQLFAIAENERRAVLLSSHIVSDLERAANKVWIVKDGRLHWQGQIGSQSYMRRMESGCQSWFRAPVINVTRMPPKRRTFMYRPAPSGSSLPVSPVGSPLAALHVVSSYGAAKPLRTFWPA